MTDITYSPPTVIAEIGCNHKGEMDIAKELIKMAAIFCKAPVAKFQKRTPRELLSEEQYNAPHPNPMHAYGETYGAHREYLELTVDQHRELMDYCNEFGVVYSSSVWDMTSAREIASLDPKLIKVPSAMNNYTAMLEYLCDNYGGQIHISTGMSTTEEVDDMVALFEKKGRAKDLVLYACTSGYPVPFEDVKLLDIPDLIQRYGGRVGDFGFSGHHLGIAIDVAAYALGATWIERHFTLDRTWKGTDHAASLEPDGLRRLVRDLNATYKSMGRKDGGLLDIEVEQREKLKWRAR
ncbi:N-acetylneuraminate synthase [Marispirochaeta aestuarii]|uniref:N-acetylneuraminate synthase n=1 Tax=Marispirochaeta aestuarii TaxID=1963862 RepID=A0A1Y1RWQ5_9SPIO|nr:N-acetylneuraminate synthase family protein [Marispirochaeta aestuarii]ORC34646.1 N-acetylneuraminate synthase [Marispirochaeta aestuarii]